MSRFNGRKRQTLSTVLVVALVLVFAVLSFFIIKPLVITQDEDAVNNENEITENKQQPTLQENQPEAELPVVEEPKPEIHRLSFAAVGDNLVHSSVYTDAMDNAEGTEKEYDFLPMYENVRQIIADADFAFVNQEAPIAGKENRGYSGYPMFNSPEQVGYDLKEVGFNIVNLANNHMLDRQTDGYRSTIEFWKNMEGVTYVGGFESREDYENIRVVEYDGITCAILSYTYGTNGVKLDESSGMVVPLCDAYSDEEIDRQTKIARELADVVIVSMHWGKEHWNENFAPTELQKRHAEIIVNNNADVIIGTHPHTLEPMMWADRPDGKKTLVIYSLGNFLSGMEYMRNHVGGVAGFDVVKTDGVVTLENAYFVPTVCHFDKWVRNFRIYKLSEYTEELLSLHGTQVRGTDKKRSFDYLLGIVKENIPSEFLIEDFYKNMAEEGTVQ